jgi:hypothetical protein
VLAGARELVTAYRQHGLTQEAFDRRFTRLARLRDRGDNGSVSSALRPVGVG